MGFVEPNCGITLLFTCQQDAPHSRLGMRENLQLVHFLEGETRVTAVAQGQR